MDEDGYVRVSRGTYAPGMSLLNGLNNVGLTAKGRQILRDKKLINSYTLHQNFLQANMEV